jgi:hypothetical protein
MPAELNWCWRCTVAQKLYDNLADKSLPWDNSKEE